MSKKEEIIRITVFTRDGIPVEPERIAHDHELLAGTLFALTINGEAQPNVYIVGNDSKVEEVR